MIFLLNVKKEKGNGKEMEKEKEKEKEMTFIRYCEEIFPDKFTGIICDPYNLRKIAGNTKNTKNTKNTVYDVIIGNSKEFFEKYYSELNKKGICVLILDKQDYKLVKKSFSINEKFNYYRFYCDADHLYFLGTNDCERYIPEYIADYKVGKEEKRKTAVVYTFHKKDEAVDFFAKHGIFKCPYVDFYIVCNGNIKLNIPDYVKYYNRDNIGHDFGGWAHAIFTASLKDRYDFFIFINSSVRGPFIPPWCPIKDWVSIFTRLIDYRTKLVGTTIGIHQYMPHIQSMVLVTDKIGLEIGIKEGIFEVNPRPLPRDKIIMEKEIGYSQTIIKHGYKIRPIVSAYYNVNIKQKSKIRGLIHISNNKYFGTNLHPYDVIFIKDKANINRNRDVIAITYNHETNHDRLSTLSDDFNWVKYLRLNPDIAKKHKNETKAVNHWINYGYSEKRKYK